MSAVPTPAAGAPSWWQRLRTRLGGDRGVAAVEAAIVTPIFLLLVVGIVEFGLAFKDQLGVTSSVRAGARIASAEPRFANFATDAAAEVAREGGAIDMTQVQELWVYKADSSGHPIGSGGGFGSCSSSCIHFTWSAAAGKFVQSSGAWDPATQDACQGEQDSLGVYLLFKHPGVTQVFFSSLGLHSYTVMRLEPIPAMQNGGCK